MARSEPVWPADLPWRGVTAVLLSLRRDVTFDPSPAGEDWRPSSSLHGRYFVPIGPQIDLDGVEQRNELAVIAAVVAERVRHDDLRLRVDRGLCNFGSGVAPGGGLRGGFRSALLASASSSALASRILSSRACLSATQSGISNSEMVRKSGACSAAIAMNPPTPRTPSMCALRS